MSTRSWRGLVFLATSLDGYLARSDHSLDWLTDPPATRGHRPPGEDAAVPDFEAHMARVDHMVMGRGTYDVVAGFDEWPYGDVPVIVVSSTLAEDTQRVIVARSIDDAAALLEQRGAKGVYVDGGQVVQEFLRRDWVDELTITLAPVILGSGRPLFGDLERETRLRLLGTRTLGGGMVSSTYEVVRGTAGGDGA